eukprot:1209807-Pyramimonas_sp.AAC.1
MRALTAPEAPRVWPLQWPCPRLTRPRALHQRSPRHQRGDAAARITQSIREVSHAHFGDNRARKALKRERDWLNEWRRAAPSGQPTTVGQDDLDDMEVDIVSTAQSRYMLAQRRNRHEPGGYFAPWKKYAAAVVEAIRVKVPHFSPTPEVSAPSESSRPRRWSCAPT